MVEKKGFKWVNERPDAESENDEKWGWIGSKPGDYVVLGLDSRSSSDGAGDSASVGEPAAREGTVGGQPWRCEFAPGFCAAAGA